MEIEKIQVCNAEEADPKTKKNPTKVFESKQNFDEFKQSVIAKFKEVNLFKDGKDIIFKVATNESITIDSQESWENYMDKGKNPTRDNRVKFNMKYKAEKPEGKRNFKLKVTDGAKFKKSLEMKNNFEEFCNDIKNTLGVDKNTNLIFKSTVLPQHNNIISQELYDSYLNEIENSPNRQKEWLNFTVNENVNNGPADTQFNVTERPNIGGAENNSKNVFQTSFEIPKGRTEKILVEKLNKMYVEFIDKIKKDLPEAKLNEAKRKFEEKEPNNLRDIQHKNIICNCCKSKESKNHCINGPRFLCAECQRFNLCLNCERLENHRKDHFMLKLNKPIDKEDEKGYDCIIDDNNKTVDISDGQPKKFSFEIINTGEKEWKKGFFLLPIGYGEGFIAGSKKMFPEDNTKKQGESWTVSLTLNVKKEKGAFISKWRMFTDKGIPFGEVLYIYLNSQ